MRGACYIIVVVCFNVTMAVWRCGGVACGGGRCGVLLLFPKNKKRDLGLDSEGYYGRRRRNLKEGSGGGGGGGGAFVKVETSFKW